MLCPRSNVNYSVDEYLRLLHLLSILRTKKALHLILESPLTQTAYIDMISRLECAERPSGFPAKHRDLHSRVLGFFSAQSQMVFSRPSGVGS